MSDSENNKPGENSVKEQIKFAVVMYGGGSLAIYINGVAQELLKMVQATSDTQHPRKFEQKKGKPIGKTVDVYRKIAFLLSDKERLATLSNISDKSELQKELDKINEELVWTNKKPSVKFVIDVLTGSSAGGINAIYLSKALVRGVDGMNDLQQLWIEQGDFAKLLNDKKSVADNGLSMGVEPASLLNSQRMYLELLKSLEGMDAAGESEKRMVDELDLFVTYTDFRGVPLPMFLSDKTVFERRHKHVFNFRYSTDGIDDFKNENNPFLAFAARTTSAFPFAFEPSRLIDIDEVLTKAMPVHRDRNSEHPQWMRYFRELADEQGNSIEWKSRSFVDGGALDNKPFGYAIDKLTQRADEGIVRRKLLYIEPSPEDFGNEKSDTAKPNAIANLLAQGVNLPRYETIREDLQRLLERNRLIRRMNRITHDVERDFEKNFDKVSKEFPDDFDWKEAGLNDVVEYKGISALPYYRLRISALTDDIAKLATAYFRFDEDSDYFKVLRSMIAVWRDSVFAENSIEEKDKEDKEVSPAQKTLNHFLYSYDVEYRFRRLRFMMRKAENLLRQPDITFKQLVDYADKKIVENLLPRPIVDVKKFLKEFDAELEDEIIEKIEKKFNAAKAKAKLKTVSKNILGISETDKEIAKESDKAVEMATEKNQEALVTPTSALYNVVPVSESAEKVITEKTISPKSKKSSEDEKPKELTEDEKLKEFLEKRLLIEKMDFKSDEFFNEVIDIQKRFNEIYHRLRREHEYLHTSLKNTELAADLLKELDKKATVADAQAKDAEVIEENLQNFMLTLGDVEYELQSLEIGRQKVDGAADAETRFKREILDKHKRIQQQEQVEKENGKLPKEILSEEEKRVLKGLSFAALERILKYLKKEGDCETAEKTDEKICITISGEKGEKALRRAYGDGFESILKALNNSAFFLDKLYNPPNYFNRRASNDMTKLLGIGVENADPNVSKTSKFIRDYLKVYYPIFDSYDQISFPVYYETTVGEAVEVDIVRISSRDASSLIDEESAGEKRRKLAGGALFNFGAFLDPRWRLNDIMWGRLDGAERLITTLLPDEDHKHLRELLIEEANTIILDEMLTAVNMREFRGIVVDSLTLTGTEAIAKKAVDRLVQNMTAANIRTGLTAALVNTLKEGMIREQIKTDYEVSRSPEPEPTLKVLSRATQVTGKMLENIADKSGVDSGRINWIAKLGQIFWGLVTVAVPNSFWNLLVNYWLQLLYTFEVVVIIGATLLLNQTVQQFGITALIITIAFHLGVMTLQNVMRGNNFLDLLKFLAIVLILCGAGLGFFTFYALTFGDTDLWKDVIGFRNNVSRYGLWNKVFALIIPGIFLIAVIGWGKIKYRNIKSFGSGFLALTFILLASGAFMDFAAKRHSPVSSPVFDLEFAKTVKKFGEIIGRPDLKPPYSETSEELELRTTIATDLKTALLVDSFIFIPVYLCMFLLLSRLLALRSYKWFGNRAILFLFKKDKERLPNEKAETPTGTFKIWLANIQQKLKSSNAVWLAIIAAIVIVGAGAADGIENFYSYKILSIPLDQLEAHTNWLTIKTIAAKVKFVLLFAGIGLLSLNFLRLPFTKYHRNIGLCVLFGILLLFSIFGIVLALSSSGIINLLLLVLIVLAFIIASVLIGLNRTFLKDF